MIARKNIGVEFLIFGVVAIILAAAVILVYPLIFQSGTNVKIGTTTFHSRLALNDVDRNNGLSGVKNLEYDQALLMAYSTSGKWSVSMKDMKIPVDIVWLNNDKRVVYLIRNTEPQTASSYKVYRPTTEARYVLELPAGSANAYTIKLDSAADFAINEGDIE